MKTKKLLLGDFNIELLKCDSNKNVSDFLDIIYSTNLVPNITSPTRLTSRSQTLKLVFIFYQIFIFSPNDSPLKTMKNVYFISSKKLFSFSRYSNFCDFFPTFPQFSDSKGQMEVE